VSKKKKRKKEEINFFPTPKKGLFSTLFSGAVAVFVASIAKQMYVDSVISLNGYGVRSNKQSGEGRVTFDFVTPPRDI
jgi:hypothetical protein